MLGKKIVTECGVKTQDWILKKRTSPDSSLWGFIHASITWNEGVPGEVREYIGVGLTRPWHFPWDNGMGPWSWHPIPWDGMPRPRTHPIIPWEMSRSSKAYTDILTNLPRNTLVPRNRCMNKTPQRWIWRSSLLQDSVLCLYPTFCYYLLA